MSKSIKMKPKEKAWNEFQKKYIKVTESEIVEFVNEIVIKLKQAFNFGYNRGYENGLRDKKLYKEVDFFGD